MSLRTRRTLGQMIEQGHEAYAWCGTCDQRWEIDLPKLVEKVGPEYSLWNRRSRCRTNGCSGYMVYKCGKTGWPHLMADEDMEMWWVFNPIQR